MVMCNLITVLTLISNKVLWLNATWSVLSDGLDNETDKNFSVHGKVQTLLAHAYLKFRV